MVQLTQHSTAAKRMAMRGARSYAAAFALGQGVQARACQQRGTAAGQRSANAVNRILAGAGNGLAGVFMPERINDPERRVLFT